MKFLLLVFLVSMVFWGNGFGNSFAEGIVVFGPKQARIDGSVPYAVIGNYKARFKVFKGTVVLNQDLRQVQSVYLEIKVNSITSNCPWCDKLARSRRLLNPAQYPKIVFKSEKIWHDEGDFKVRGILAMHGIEKQMTFPFNVEIIDEGKVGKKLLNLKGSWTFNRKDFNIVWSKLLDRDGILVGDNITVNWGIRAYI